MNALMFIAQKHKLAVVEDTAQAIGTTYQVAGKPHALGTIGDIGTTSFFPSKNLGCFGDGGACFTNDDALAHKIKMVINHGSQKKYYHELVGVNSRLDTLQAAVLKVKLTHLDDFISRRQQAADFYDQAFSDHSQLQIPKP